MLWIRFWRVHGPTGTLAVEPQTDAGERQAFVTEDGRVSEGFVPLGGATAEPWVQGRHLREGGGKGAVAPTPRKKIICRAKRLTRVATSSQDVFYAL